MNGHPAGAASGAAGVAAAVVVLVLVALGLAAREERTRVRARRRLAHASAASTTSWSRRSRVRRRLWLPLPTSVRRPVEGMGLPWAPDTTVGVTMGAFAALASMALLAAGPGAAAVVVGVGAAGGPAALVAGAGRANRLVDRDLVGLLDRLSAGLRSGASLSAALGESARSAHGPLRTDLDQLCGRLESGVSFPDALARWAALRATPAVATTVAALAIAHGVGGGAARAVDGVATSLRDRASVRREVVALSTQARASAVVVVLAPLAFGVLSGAADHQSWTFLTTTPFGLSCLAGGLVLDLAGGLWMAWLAHRVGRM